MHESSLALAEYIRSTSERFRIVANRSWINAGRPVAADPELSVLGVRGIVEYVPGDLTITVRAGTSHTEIDAATFQEGQWLGLDPAGADLGTIGATIATASVGPLVHGIGAVRDIVLGMEVVAGNGVITRSGGKVVKNVAGFDLVRLQTGAWGTLGVITEVSLRLRARPEVDRTVAIELDARTPLLAHLVRLRNLTLSPLAIELIDARLAQSLAISRQQTFLIRLGGNETRVTSQRTQLATIGPLIDCNTAVWEALRGIEHNVSVTGALGSARAVARVSHLPSQLPLAWSHVHAELGSASLEPSFARATISRGAIRVVVPHSPNMSHDEFASSLTSVTRTLAPPGGHVVWEQLPGSCLGKRALIGVADKFVAAALQRTFDPQQPLQFRNTRRHIRCMSALPTPRRLRTARHTRLQNASAGLDACVHCGFCLQACPTYVNLQDENDSPRGRLVLMRRLLEGDMSRSMTPTPARISIAASAAARARRRVRPAYRTANYLKQRERRWHQHAEHRFVAKGHSVCCLPTERCYR